MHTMTLPCSARHPSLLRGGRSPSALAYRGIWCSIHRILSHPDSGSDSVMFCSAWSLTFVAFLRVSEITASPPIEPAPAAVEYCQAIHHMGFRLHVKFSTANLVGAGHFIYIGATGTHLCPVLALRSNLAHRGALAGPFVVWLVRHPVTIEQVNCYLRVILSRAGAGVRVRC